MSDNPERIILTGIDPEELTRVLGSAGLQNFGMQVVRPRPPRAEKEAIIFPIPEHLRGNLGVINYQQYSEFMAGEGHSVSTMNRLWFDLARYRLDQDIILVQDDPLYPVDIDSIKQSTEGLSKNTRNRSYKYKLDKAERLARQLASLDALVEAIESGSLIQYPGIGEGAVEIYGTVIAHRVMELQTQERESC